MVGNRKREAMRRPADPNVPDLHPRKCPLSVKGCRFYHVGITTRVPQIAAGLLLPNRQERAKPTIMPRESCFAVLANLSIECASG